MENLMQRLEPMFNHVALAATGLLSSWCELNAHGSSACALCITSSTCPAEQDHCYSHNYHHDVVLWLALGHHQVIYRPMNE